MHGKLYANFWNRNAASVKAKMINDKFRTHNEEARGVWHEDDAIDHDRGNDISTTISRTTLTQGPRDFQYDSVTDLGILRRLHHH